MDLVNNYGSSDEDEQATSLTTRPSSSIKINATPDVATIVKIKDGSVRKNFGLTYYIGSAFRQNLRCTNSHRAHRQCHIR